MPFFILKSFEGRRGTFSKVPRISRHGAGNFFKVSRISHQRSKKEA